MMYPSTRFQTILALAFVAFGTKATVGLLIKNELGATPVASIAIWVARTLPATFTGKHTIILRIMTATTVVLVTKVALEVSAK